MLKFWKCLATSSQGKVKNNWKIPQSKDVSYRTIWSGKPPFQTAFLPKVGGGLGWSFKNPSSSQVSPEIRLRKDLVSSPGWSPQPTISGNTPKKRDFFDHFLTCLAKKNINNGSKIAGPPKADLKIIKLMLRS